MGRLLVLMGSCETTPTMVSLHQRVLAAAGDGVRLVLETPYGFQENAAELSERAVAYFRRNVGRDVEVLDLRDSSATGPVALQVSADRIAGAAWVFAGPGSPTYFARQLLATPVQAALQRRLTDPERPSATVLASAAACTVGRLAIPVYEIYKVGSAPTWHEGLDLLRPAGIDAVVVPHYDNAEGGTHDTSCCYIGDRRLRQLEELLEPQTWVLGIDEHTAAVLDLEERSLTVEGRGRVVARVRGTEHAIPSGSRIALDELLAIVGSYGAAVDGSAPSGAPPRSAPAPREDDPDGFGTAVRAGDLIAAAEVTAGMLRGTRELDEEVRATIVQHVAALAGVAQAGLHEHRVLVAPHVEALLALRQRARDERRFDDADAIRDSLAAAGIAVRDGAGDTAWDFTDPLEEAMAQALGFGPGDGGD